VALLMERKVCAIEYTGRAIIGGIGYHGVGDVVQCGNRIIDGEQEQVDRQEQSPVVIVFEAEWEIDRRGVNQSIHWQGLKGVVHARFDERTEGKGTSR